MKIARSLIIWSTAIWKRLLMMMMKRKQRKEQGSNISTAAIASFVPAKVTTGGIELLECNSQS